MVVSILGILGIQGIVDQRVDKNNNVLIEYYLN